jgi:amino acid transporter
MEHPSCSVDFASHSPPRKQRIKHQELAIVLGHDLIAMWNYMAWDNASTVAGQVRNPQRKYPLALLGALALIATCYIIPVAALWHTGIADVAAV